MIKFGQLRKRIRLRIPYSRYPFHPKKYPWGSLVWRKEPGIELPASPGAIAEEFIPSEHTQSTGPSPRSFYNPEHYLETLYRDKRPSITREEI